MKRTRLSPQARRQQILDATRELIARGGIQQFSLKQLIAELGISEPLLFHYFPSRVDLLQQLLKQVYTAYVSELESQVEQAANLREVLEIFITRNYEHYHDDNVMDVLLSDPAVAAIVRDERRAYLDRREKFLINSVASELGIKRKKAAMLALMASRASLGAAEFAHNNKTDPEETINTVMEFVVAGFESQRAG